MKKFLVLAVAMIMLLSVAVSALADTTIQPDTNLKVAKPASLGANPAVEGESPFTGLPADMTYYTPILLVYDNSPEGYMHWGSGSADILLQIPNQSTGNNKVLGLFCSEFPEYAGGSRSARMTALPFALAFDSAFASANYSPITVQNVSVDYWRKEWGYKLDEKWFDLLSGRTYKHRETGLGLPSDANLLAHLREIRQILIDKGVQFEKRPFLFTDEPLTRGDAASFVEMKFFAGLDSTSSDSRSDCTFYYEDGVGYQREMSRGIEFDRETSELLTFANVIVMRAKIETGSDGVTTCLCYKDNLVGGGQADIFQSGRYIKGTWYRDGVNGRLIFTDDEGNELKFQRGKTYIVVNDERCVVTYGE